MIVLSAAITADINFAIRRTQGTSSRSNSIFYTFLLNFTFTVELRLCRYIFNVDGVSLRMFTTFSMNNANHPIILAPILESSQRAGTMKYPVGIDKVVADRAAAVIQMPYSVLMIAYC